MASSLSTRNAGLELALDIVYGVLLAAAAILVICALASAAYKLDSRTKQRDDYTPPKP